VAAPLLRRVPWVFARLLGCAKLWDEICRQVVVSWTKVWCGPICDIYFVDGVAKLKAAVDSSSIEAEQTGEAEQPHKAETHLWLT
jgi:hypothetical protein